MSGVTLTYFSVMLKSTTSDSSGNYAFPVSYDWSGTVTPSMPGYYSFTPVNTLYNHVTDNKINQDYTATPIFHTITGNVGVGGRMAPIRSLSPMIGLARSRLP